MNHKRESIDKLLDDGYTLLRIGVKDADGWPVKACSKDSGFGNWRTIARAATRKELDKYITSLIENEDYLMIDDYNDRD